MVWSRSGTLVQESGTLKVDRALDSNPWWRSYVGTNTYVLDGTFETYNFTFVMTEETYDNGKIVFELGEINGDRTTTTVDVSDVTIVKGVKITN